MIEVTVRKDEIKISGHANYAVSGSDIVCAGVTALAQTLIKSIEDLTDDKIEYEISPGRVDIKHRDLSEKSRTLVDSFFIGVCTIADEFPDAPVELVMNLVAEDADGTKAAVEAFATMYKEAVQNAVKDALKGKPPKACNGGDKPSMTKEQILAVKNPSERQKLIAENITLFQ